MLHKPLLAIVLLVLSGLSVATEKLDPLNFESQQSMAGTFTQSKFFKVLKYPIKSAGEFYLDQKLGFYWQTNKPVFSAVYLKSGQLMLRDHNNNVKAIEGGASLAQVLIGAISGNVSALEQEFIKKNTGPLNCYTLIPKQESLAKAIVEIEICGGKTPESITLFEPAGNRTEIKLSYNKLVTLPEAIRAQLQ